VRLERHVVEDVVGHQGGDGATDFLELLGEA
jgi:hypothetical protein